MRFGHKKDQHRCYNSINDSDTVVDNSTSSEEESLDHETSYKSVFVSNSFGSRATKGISLVLLSVLVASIGIVCLFNGSIKTVPAGQLRRENDLQSITGIDRQDLEPHRIEVVTKSTSTKTLENEAGSITATISSSAVKKPITANFYLSVEPLKKPQRQESTLGDEDWDVFDKGADAINLIDGTMIHKLPDVKDPAEVMNFLGSASNLISGIIPQFALAGAVFNILGTILGGATPNETKDPMIGYFEDRFTQVDTKLDKLLKKLGGIPLSQCKSKWDENLDNYITDYNTFINIMKNKGESGVAKDIALGVLRRKCLEKNPMELLGRLRKDFVGGGGFTECFQEAIDDSANRVLYFRREYSGPFTRFMMQAAELNGLCQGIYVKEEPSDSSSAVMSTQEKQKKEDTEIATIFKEIYVAFQKAEKQMFDSGALGMYDSLQNKLGLGKDVSANATKIYEASKDFFPGWKYATVQTEPGRANNFKRDNPLKNSYGTFGLDNGVFVMYRNPIDKTNFSSNKMQPMWKNGECPSTRMCKRKENSCSARSCDDTSYVRHSLKLNNRKAYDEYQDRNAFMIRTSKEVKECHKHPRQCCNNWGSCYDCGKTVCDWGDATPEFELDTIKGDQEIVEKFETNWEQGNDSKRWKYTIIGIGGNGEDIWNGS